MLQINQMQKLLLLVFFLSLDLFAIDGKTKIYLKSDTDIYTSQKVTVAVELLSNAFSITDAKIIFPPSKKYIVQAPKSASYLGQEEINDENILDLIGTCSLILDGTDNLKTRKVLNRASLKKGIPFIFGGVDGFNGMTTTFIPGETPCLECLFPLGADMEKTPGVIGPLPGMVASIQSLEAIKIILGMDTLLSGRLFFIQGNEMTVKEIIVERNPGCKVCKPSGDQDG